MPGVEVLAVELVSPSRFCVYVDHPEGVDHALCVPASRGCSTTSEAATRSMSRRRGRSGRLRKPAHFRAAVGQAVAIRTATEIAGKKRFRGAVVAVDDRALRLAAGDEALDIPYEDDRPGQSDRRGTGAAMSEEIIEGIRTIEREKGIETGTLVAALEDALLAAYKKTPGAARHAEVMLDDDGEFKVFAIQIPAELETRLLEEAREAEIDELERIEEETGEHQHTLINDDELDLDWSQVPDADSSRSDVTPHDFGRIAAMTAKQVIQQRIREAERAMMYDEYVDRQGEVVTGIVQQAGDRNNVLVDLGNRGGVAAPLRAGGR